MGINKTESSPVGTHLGARIGTDELYIFIKIFVCPEKNLVTEIQYARMVSEPLRGFRPSNKGEFVVSARKERALQF